MYNIDSFFVFFEGDSTMFKSAILVVASLSLLSAGCITDNISSLTGMLHLVDAVTGTLQILSPVVG